MADRIFKLTFLGDASKALRELDKLGAGMSGTAKAGLAAGAAIGASVGAVAVAGFVKSIKVAADYEKAIDAVAATAGASAAETKALYEQGLRIGKETTFSATEAAAAMEELAAGGLSVNQILGGAADATVALAAAASIDLASAANLTGRAMNVWKLEQEDLNDVVNRSAAVALESSFTAADLGLAIGQGGGVAAAAGVSFQDFATAITLTASSFNSGSDAGTSFKQFLNGLTPNAAKAKKEMRALGLITEDGKNQFFDAAGSLKSMEEVTNLLNIATRDMTEEQRSASLEIIFGSDAMRMAAALAAKTGEEFAALNMTMAGTDAADLAAQRLGNAAGAMEQLRGAIETIQIELGSKFLPILAKVATFLAEFFPKIPTWAFLAVGGVMALVGAFSALALAFLPLVGLAAALGVGMFAVLGPVLLVTAAIAALVAIGVVLWQNWDAIEKKAAAVRDAIMSIPGADTTAKVVGAIAPGSSMGGAVAGALTAAANVVPGGGLIATGANSIYKGIKGGFDSGGVIPGPTGAPRLIMAHAGETVLPTHRGGMGNTYNFNIGTMVGADQEAERVILGALQNLRMRGALPA